MVKCLVQRDGTESVVINEFFTLNQGIEQVQRRCREGADQLLTQLAAFLRLPVLFIE